MHERLTGVLDDVILNNLSKLCEAGASVILRCPIVGGANLDDGFIGKIITLSKGNSAIQKVQLMPYHSTGIEKSAALGKTAQKRFGKPSEAELERIAWEIESKSGKRCFFE